MRLPRTHLSADQQGQASIFILALIGVVLVSAIFLYQAGRLTSEKMELQNAADAAAYGASVLEARSLNFCAYTNRAMVANEVAIGQVVGLLSLTDEIRSSGEYLETYADIIQGSLDTIEAILAFLPIAGWVADAVLAVLDALVAVMEGAGEVIKDTGEAVKDVLEVIATPVVYGLSINNEVYSVSQTLYHGATMVLVTTEIFKSMEDNTYGSSFNFLDLFKRNNRKGAQVSDMGLLALALHMPSYWSGYTKRYSTNKTKSEEESREKQKDNGMGRFAATVREARDPFSSGGDPVKVKNFLGMEVEYANRDWFIGLEIDEHADFNLEPAFALKFRFEEGVGLYSVGGSELRKKGDSFTWSALDTLLGGPHFAYDITAESDLLDIHKHWKKKLEVGFPFGGGISQAASSASGKNTLTPLDFDNPVMELNFYNKDFTPSPYGGAGELERFAMVDLASEELEGNTLSGYTGLKAYRDRPIDKADEDPNKPGLLPFKSPFFLVGLTREMKDITDKGPQFDGNLDLIDDAYNKIQKNVTVIAKSQVYFSRPKDLSYFVREDKKEENSNVFSPFWQSRLVKTTDMDRLLALVLQDHVVWLPGQLQQDVPGMKKIIDFLQNIFKVFR